MYVAEEIREHIKSRKIFHENGEILTVSMGIATLNTSDIDSYEELIKYADMALYKAKRDGKDRSEIFQLKLKQKNHMEVQP